MTERPMNIPRFELADRIEHFVMLLSFTTLAFTGLVQMFSQNAFSLAIIRGLGGIETTRTIHHATAIVFILSSVFHLFRVGYKIYVLRRPLSMMPSLKDMQDAFGLLKYNIGLSNQRPAMSRYTFGEKIEYFAGLWGNLVMIVTGYMLLNPLFTTRILPGEVVPAAKLAHGYEAVLAVLSILIWHAWHVHIKHFNKSMFTGVMAIEEMEEDHALELERIEAGVWPQPLPPGKERWRRGRLYLPLAGLLAILLLGGGYYIFTEKTAITTLPPVPAEKVYAPAAPPGLPTVTPASAEMAEIPARITLPAPEPMPIHSHPVDEARADCQACHGPFTYIAPGPLDHVDYQNDGCTACHSAAKEASQ